MSTNLQVAVSAEPEPASTEAQAFADILAWSEDCPPWQKDALRRLCLKGELGADDFDVLETICKGDRVHPRASGGALLVNGEDAPQEGPPRASGGAPTRTSCALVWGVHPRASGRASGH